MNARWWGKKRPPARIQHTHGTVSGCRGAPPTAFYPFTPPLWFSPCFVYERVTVTANPRRPPLAVPIEGNSSMSYMELYDATESYAAQDIFVFDTVMLVRLDACNAKGPLDHGTPLGA